MPRTRTCVLNIGRRLVSLAGLITASASKDSWAEPAAATKRDFLGVRAREIRIGILGEAANRQPAAEHSDNIVDNRRT